MIIMEMNNDIECDDYDDHDELIYDCVAVL